jgi:hypothetical protein
VARAYRHELAHHGPARRRRRVQAVDHAIVTGQHESAASAEQRQSGLRQGAAGCDRGRRERCERSGDFGGIAGHPDRDLADPIRSVQCRSLVRRAQHGALLTRLVGPEQSGATDCLSKGFEIAPHRDRIEPVRVHEASEDHILGVAVPQRAPYLCGGMVELKQPARTPVVDDDPIEEWR